MPSLHGYENVECKTIDGITIRGWFYAVDGVAPAIIMTPGFNCVKEMLLPEIAERFQSLGYNALVYDPRSTGASDGHPRNQIDPLKQSEDLSDILTYVAALPTVDASRIIFWGMSLGGTISGCAAAFDRRARAAIMACPLFTFWTTEKRESVLLQLTKDRKSQLKGNEGFTLPPFNSKGENPIGMAGSGGPGGLESYAFMKAVIERGTPGFRNAITLQTYHKLAMWFPKELLKLDNKTPVMMITPELDTMSPPEEQKEVFEGFQQPKRLYFAKGKTHLTVLSGDGSEEVLAAQIDFIKAVVEGTLK